ncbi:MAG: ATP-binding cassette domain-containing protein [Peptococcaceae bacterium]|nr:ATP-binding cassette domain-containing protein [Peptococcaceae bacterium]
MSLKLDSVYKSFGQKTVVDYLDLTIPRGEIFGLLGPNGAGKTTTMRMILDIIRPDTGSITWLGHKIGLDSANSFGYLPEERGLYPKMVVAQQMKFFSRLRGLSNSEAEKHISYWVERFELGDLVQKKASELSKGNQQKVQFILAIVHNPDLLILDEPFSGLDPLNVELLKSALGEFAQQGRTILFSSHRMEHVEELCSSLCIIDQGKIIAQGGLTDVKSSTGRQIIRLSLIGNLDFLRDLPINPAKIRFNHFKASAASQAINHAEFDLPNGLNPQSILRLALERGDVIRFELGVPSLNDVFISLVGGDR